MSHQPFPRPPLRREALDADPLVTFARWLEAAETSEPDPYAMTLATAGPEGEPSARTVSLKRVDPRGLVFTSRYDGPKGGEIDRDPLVALVFYWAGEGRQVRVSGVAERLPEEEAERYFRDRPRESQLALLALPQSEPLDRRATLEARAAALGRTYATGEVPRPAWGAYLVRPRAVEFWQGQTDRLHDRFLYEASEGGGWSLVRLTP
jgi:pyridoxamine 5'-phosphate oxidase